MKNIFLICLFSIASYLYAPAQYKKLFDFENNSSGKNPWWNLYFDGTFLYGNTNFGGVNNMGVLYKIKPDGTGYLKLLDFAGAINGSNPQASLISIGTYLYGTTAAGGTGNSGSIFKIKPDGTGYSKLFSFVPGTSTGTTPRGTLISDGTYFYGTTVSGGAYNLGVMYKVKQDGTGFSKLLDFSGTVNGHSPWGSLFLDGVYLYGTTYGGGPSNYGTIFKIKPDGSGYMDLLDFAGISNGRDPRASLISDGTFLYGMTTSGGVSDIGTIFKIKPDGTGYVRLYAFADTLLGKYPNGSLLFNGTFLYGMTQGGGANNLGIIFRLKPDGSGFSKLFDFSSINGGTPQGSLISIGNELFGNTFQGGLHDDGVLFKYGISTGINGTNLETELKIYPNPTNGKLIIIYKEAPIDNYDLTITNILGETIYYKTAIDLHTSNEIDISNFPKGIYNLRIGKDGNIFSKKIVVK